VPEAGILKINNLQKLQKDLTQKLSNYNDSRYEFCRQNSSFSEVHLITAIVSPFSSYLI